MKKSLLLAAGFALLLSACETASVSNTPPRVAPPGIPSAAIDLGDRTAAPNATLRQFEQNVQRRYLPGLAFSAVTGDLRNNEFSCAANTDNVRGDPPDQICRRTMTAESCTHTWQVHLYDQDNNSILTRARGLYDRRCGNDGLLGGPG